ncbi:glycosyltransferase [Cryobacterium algoricola]|uniref:Glycosyltransferase n=1 Tax=Cryobacterium algoricola TaxID=1259183 RepID=A0ABY2I9N6_9MICO|nr:glycosyltransferase [Cryobacterium algoricola]TFB84419.1 glycosyltransferase [Cryobacterium algoricola]
MTRLRLEPAMHNPIAPDWPGASWVGTIDEFTLARAVASPASPASAASTAAAGAGRSVDTLAECVDATGYARARLLVRRGADIRGFVDVALTDGCLDLADLHARVALLPPPDARIGPVPAPDTLPAFTVVVCTRDRTALLRSALLSVLAIDYPHFEVLVVDNAPATHETRDLLASEFAGRVRRIEEPVPGLSQARNTGLRNALGELVAFTDDDVTVDPFWLHALATGFARGEDVECVAGLVPSGELRTAVQAFFDGRVSWSRNLRPRHFRLADPPEGLPMFPFSVGEFGTGANFALRRSYALGIGGFDTAFGVGTRTGGGEDLDMFTRVILAGRGLVVEPSALVWHRHRDDLAALRHQARGYGTGLGAWLTKIALNPRTARIALRRSPTALVHLVRKGGGALPDSGERMPAAGSATDAALRREINRVGWYELACVARGPWAYLRQRRAGAQLHNSCRSEPPGQTPPEFRGTPLGRAESGGVMPFRERDRGTEAAS